MLKTLITEPVNLFIAIALILLAFGIHMNGLPVVAQDILSKLSVMMTPLVLLFIGLAVKIKKQQFFEILSLLTLRAGLVFILAGVIVALRSTTTNEVLLLLAFGLSACSFWPFSHICVVDSLEVDKSEKTFNTNYAVAILALSFPLSTVLILGVLNSGQVFAYTPTVFMVGFLLLGLALIKPLLNFIKTKKATTTISVAKKINATRTEQVS